MSAESNRAKCPKFAAFMAEFRQMHPEAKVRFVQEGSVTLGSEPALEPHLWEVSAETLKADRERNESIQRRGVRGGR